MQYELLADHPFELTQEDVLFQTWLTRQVMRPTKVMEVARIRQQFFSRPQPCLRSSPLPKQYGFGLHFDERGRVAICPMESREYAALLTGRKVRVLRALRSSRRD